MAAARELLTPDIVDLRNVAVEELEPLLREETAAWRERLHWDFSASADLVRRFVGMGALSGFALRVQGDVAGYAYYVCEDRKGLIGDLYVMNAFRAPGVEAALLQAVVEHLMGDRSLRRIEAQLIMAGTLTGSRPPFEKHSRTHRRLFMIAELANAPRLAPGRAALATRFENWLQYRQEEAAKLIAEAYRGHIDSDINDQYRSVPGARRFLMNIVQYPGCGSFFQPASLQASNSRTGAMTGICLASLVASDAGHITQVCVASGARQQGVGYEMLRRSLLALSRHGCVEATLTVTAENRSAADLYVRMGFRSAREFSAFVWEGW